MALDGMSSERSPTLTLLLGLTITLAAVVSYSWYVTRQISGLRTVQRELADRNRRDSLQLLRIQNDLNAMALAMRDMLNIDEKHPLAAWAAQFQRIRGDLNDAFQQEDKVAVGHRTLEQRQYLTSALAQFWGAIDRTFVLAQLGREFQARAQIRRSLQAQQAALSNTVARLLVENNESEEQTALRVSHIYDGVQRQAYLFLCGTLTTILLTTLYLVYSSRKLFAKLSLLSQQRSELARKLISTQESILRHISRELHDEFGQILTAVGAMLSRMCNRAPQDSCICEELQEIREITQATLNNVRGLSQALHPVILEEGGIESALDWYLPNVERQTGIVIRCEKSGSAPPLANSAAIHVYRVLQEALNNAIRHSQASEVWIRLQYSCDALVLEVEDHGTGFLRSPDQPGIGLTGMHERAEILGGQINFLPASPAGTLVRLTVPICVDSCDLETVISNESVCVADARKNPSASLSL
jgi:signal transduction histidine kinase